MNQRRCEVCGKRIPAERLDILPDTQTCVACSEEKSKSAVIMEDGEIIVQEGTAQIIKKGRSRI